MFIYKKSVLPTGPVLPIGNDRHMPALSKTYWCIKSAPFVHGQVSAREQALDGNDSNINSSYFKNT